MSLPKGGGAIRGIGEKFAANPVTGSGAMSVPLALSPGRGGFAPALSLSYDSGNGNGPFGFGWQLALPAISRKTDKGVPRYGGAALPDTFMLAGAEDLVPVLVEEDGEARAQRESRAAFGSVYAVRRYRPRIEGGFARIEHWSNEDDDADTFWRSISADNVTTWYGRSAESRVFDPADPRRVYSWLVCETHDARGNVASYHYQSEDSRSLDAGALHERNRDATSRSANRYLKRIRYGYETPYFPDLADAPRTALPERWCFELVLDYGEHDDAAPRSQVQVRDWPRRGDPFSSYRAGFEIRCYRLCRRVLMFHHFADEDEVGEDCLVRSTDFDYRFGADDAPQPIYAFLRAVTHAGYRRRGEGGYLRSAMPPLEFEYSAAVIDEELHELDAASLRNLPAGVDGANPQWVDLDGEGMPGILTEQAGHAYFKRNEGPVDDRGRASFGPANPLPTLPASAARGLQLLDLAGDGRLELVDFAGPVPGFHERTSAGGWTAHTPFTSLPELDWADANLRFIDLTGDGSADLLITENDALCWHASLAEAGFGPAQRTRKAIDEELGPRIVFADATQSIFLADMCGDGLSDIVRVRNGDICYWPNLGHGRFGAKVGMDNAPRLAASDAFEARRVRLADIDGSGTADLLYLAAGGVRIHFNRCGNGWSAGRELAASPRCSDANSVAVVDLLGSGTACLVWSSPLAGETRRPLRYLDLMGGNKPHLLVGARNNLGAETRVRYVASTRFYVQDRAAGTPWITRLPFPVHVVERVETLDRISRNRFVTRYRYRHGYFDGHEREFRGFGRVDQWDTEDIAAAAPAEGTPAETDDASYAPPVHTRTWFHTGAYLEGVAIGRQFESEYFREPGFGDEDAAARLLPDTIVASGLRLHETREACRALKGSMLRQEVYAEDGTPRAAWPYTVTEHAYAIRRLQPLGGNAHAVFLTHARESIACQYERDPLDPRVLHQLTLAVDDFGNVLRAATIAYGRRVDDTDLLAQDRQRQRQLLASCSERIVTNGVDRPDAWRTPLTAETRNFELTGLTPADGSPRLSMQQVEQALEQASTIGHEATPDGTFQLRLTAHQRMRYRPDDLGVAAGDAQALLPAGVVEAMAWPGASRTLAFTPGLLSEVYGERVDDSTLLEGGYVQEPGDEGWWLPAARTFFSAEAADTPAQELAVARQHFYRPRRFVDAFGGGLTVSYDAHDLLPIATRDALDNTVQALNDYRVLQPRLVTDANGNRSALAFDANGLVVGTAAMGKAGEGRGDSLDGFAADLDAGTIAAHLAAPLADPHALLQGASTRLVHDLFAFQRTQADEQPQAPVVCMLARETHQSDLEPGETTRVQQSFSYSDGFGREIQRKLQAEAGPVPERDADGHVVLGVDGRPVTAPGSSNTRWVGSGWIVFDGKGRPVRRFEPFFTDTHRFEFEPRIGVSPLLMYDAMGRVMAVLHADHRWEKMVFGAWRQALWDGNDTSLIDDPASDADVGRCFVRLPAADYLPTWHALRIGGAIGARERAAAQKTAVHAATPTLLHFDVLGRPFLTVVHNRFERDGATVDERHATRFEFDIDGRQRAVRDAVVQAGDPLGRIVQRDEHDLLGNVIHRASIDAGERWLLNDVHGQPLRAWDSRGHALRTEYDALRRPSRHFVRGHDAQHPQDELLYGRIDYGEGEPDAAARNLRTRPARVFDAAGVVANEAYDFEGNLVQGSRRLAVDYRTHPDWSATPALQTQRHEFRNTYDALGRPRTVTTPDASVTRPSYDAGGALQQLSVQLAGAADATQFIAAIERDAAGRRLRIDHGNGVRTTCSHDPQSLRLTRLLTRRGAHVLQDLSYVYDPAGNITDLRDDAQQTVWFDNAVVEPHADYRYDALYRLIEASGREHAGQPSTPQTSWNDAGRTGLSHPHDGHAMRRYTERYAYDAVGNLLQLEHQAGGGGWSRSYGYDEASPIEPAKQGNRLSRTQLGAVGETYGHDAHGNVTRMPHLPLMAWDFQDRLRASARQLVGEGSPQTTWYVYDATGRRVRKVTERSAGAGQTPTRMHERIDLGGFEVYREFGANGETLVLERQTLHVMDDRQRIAMVESRTLGDDGSPLRLLRYQFGNHLGSVGIELDAAGAIVSYEEYHPYGSTAYQGGRTLAEASLKRYRYSGKERDEETGLADHGARYYAAWLGRWIAADPAGHERPEHGAYLFAAANPVKYIDPDGKRYQVRIDHTARTVTFEAKVYTIDDQSYQEATDVARTLNRFSRTIEQDNIDYQVKFDIDVVAPPTPEFLESKLGTSLHWKVGRKRVRREKYRNAAQRWIASVLPSQTQANVYLGENPAVPELQKVILDYGKSLGLTDPQMKAVRNRLSGLDKQHAPEGIEGVEGAPETVKVSRGSTYVELAVQMRAMKSGTSAATQHNIRLHEFLHLLGLFDVDVGHSVMDYGFVEREDKKQARARKLGPQDSDVENLVNTAIQRAQPDPQNTLQIDVIEPVRIEDWQKTFTRFRDWTWVNVK